MSPRQTCTCETTNGFGVCLFNLILREVNLRTQLCVLRMQFGGVQLRRLWLYSQAVHASLSSSHPRLYSLHTHAVKRCGAVVTVTHTDSAESLHAELQQLCEDIEAYAHERSSVTGTERLFKRAQRDRVYVDGLLQSAGKVKSAAAAEEMPASSSPDLQGVRNNIRGLQAELDLAWQAEAVVCLGAKFYSHVSAGVF